MKTRLYTRKRALISSVAMLLVAMIALGTATFAWFTSDPTAKASGLKMKTTASTGLVIQTESRRTVSASLTTDDYVTKERNEWRHTDYLNYAFNTNTHVASTSANSVALNATSFDLTGDKLGTPVKVLAGAEGSYDAKQTAIVSKAEGGLTGGDFYQEKIYCKVTGTATSAPMKATSLSITDGGNANLKSTARVAIEFYDSSARTTTLIGVYALDNQKQHGYLVNFNSAEGVTNYFGAVPTDASGTTNVVSATDDYLANPFVLPSAVNNIAIGTVDNSGNDYVTVTVYVDGQDDNCYTNNFSLTDIISSIELNLSVAP